VRDRAGQRHRGLQEGLEGLLAPMEAGTMVATQPAFAPIASAVMVHQTSTMGHRESVLSFIGVICCRALETVMGITVGGTISLSRQCQASARAE
jgi:hypothetical protein